MNDFSYRIYYQWNGPDKTDPFTSEKSREQIETASREFPSELTHRLNDPTAQIEATEVGSRTNEITLSIKTTESHVNVEVALVAALKSWHLFGEKLEG